MFDVYDNGVFVNRLGVRDQTKLAEKERVLSIIALKDLKYKKIELNKEGLKEVHKTLFGSIYNWGGHYRQSPISKEDSLFTPHKDIDKQLTMAFQKFEKDKQLTGLDKEVFAYKVSELFGEINHIHPFREGNGRTQRAFIEKVAENAGHKLDFNSITNERMIVACIEYEKGKISLLHDVFRESVDPNKLSIVNEFNDFFRKEQGRDVWQGLNISYGFEGRNYEGKFIGSAENSFTIQDSKNNIHILDIKHKPQNIQTGQEIKIDIALNLESKRSLVAEIDGQMKNAKKLSLKEYTNLKDSATQKLKSHNLSMSDFQKIKSELNLPKKKIKR